MKKETMKRVMTAGLALAVSAGILSGCGNDAGDGSTAKLTMWCVNYVNKYVTNYGDIEAFQELQKNAGVEVEYQHPVAGQEAEQFNLLMASGNLPDIVEADWTSRYTGGLEKAISDGIIVPIEDYLDKAPNYRKLLEENPELEKGTKSTDGKQLIFHSLKEDIKINSYTGPQIRKDWLDKLGLPVPTTIDEWHTTLTAFKEQDPNGNGLADEIPLADDKTMAFRHFAAAWGCIKGEFYENARGEFVYGSIEPEYKAFLEEMHKWYEEGLIDPEFASITRKNVDANMTTDISGAFVGLLGSQMGNYIAAMRGSDSDYELLGTPWPIGPANKPYCATPGVVRLTVYGSGAAITKNCKDIDSAMKYLDYCYSDEAYDLQNWGIEGVTYNKTDDGSYQYTDLILNNPDGKGTVEAMAPYAVPAYGGTKMMDSTAYVAFMHNEPAQKEASATWASGDNSLLLPSYSYTAEEARTISNIMGDITTYEDEMFTKMIIGTVSIDEFDNYVAKIKELGIEEAIALHKQAYERYMGNE